MSCTSWSWLAFVLLTSPLFAATDSTELGRVQATLAGEIEATLDATGIPSISIALIQSDQIVWSQAFGYANAKLKVPATPDTIYSTGSCMKPVTAMAVLQLIDAGKLALDDPVNMHLGEHAIEDMSDDGKPITVRHLLSHYSGIETDFQMLPVWQRRTPRTLEGLAAAIHVDRAPGTRFHYSNAGFALAGLLVQEVSGQSFESYVVDRILEPLEIDYAGPFNPTPSMLEQMSIPYRLEGRRAFPDHPHRFDVFPAGDAYLSAPAMAKILLTHLNEGKSGDVRILSQAAVQEMRTPQFGGRSGLDFGLRESGGEKFVSHGGGVPGYSTFFILGVDSKVGVYLAANASGVHTSIRAIGQLSVDLLRGKEIGEGLVRKIAGIGTGLQSDDTTGRLVITTVLRRSPASEAGLSAGTTIVKINGTAVGGKTVQECLALMQGPAGTTVQLELAEQAGTRLVELTKKTLLIPS